MIVIDASALVKVLIERSGSGDAVRKRLVGEALVAPAHIDVEVLSVLRGLTLGGKIAADRAKAALAMLSAMPMQRAPLSIHLDRGWQLRGNYSAYDALYVSLAEVLACPLVTSDGKMAKAAGARCLIEVFP